MPDALPDPFDDADALEELEEEITTLAAHIHAATHRFLTLVGEFDRRRGWELGGHRSCAHWLAARTGFDLATSREKVRTARALGGLPRTSAAMARGQLSFSKVRALTRVATDNNEGDLLELARGCTTAELERVIRGFRGGSREDEREREERRQEERCVSVFPDHDGMYLIRGRLTPEVGALLMRAIEAAGDALYQDALYQDAAYRDAQHRTAPYREEGASSGESDRHKAAAQRRADALGLLAERALAAGFGRGRGPEAGGADAEQKDADQEQRDPSSGGGGADAEGRRGVGEEGNGGAGGETPSAEGPAGARSAEEGAAAPDPAPISGSRAERYQVVLHVEPETLRSRGAELGRSELEDGTRVSAETSQRLSCDCGLVRVRYGADGKMLDVGRKRRTVPPALRRALEARDRGCRFPGCGLRFTEGHHVTHWAEGGETKLENLVLLCRHHHRLVHEGGWTVGWWGPGKAVFYDPRGGVHFDGRWEWPAGVAGRPKGMRKRGETGERPKGGGDGPEGFAGREEMEEPGDLPDGEEPEREEMEEPGDLPDGEEPERDRHGSADLAAALVRGNRARGVEPDGLTAGARWERGAAVPDRVYFRALEALDETL